MFYIHDHDQGTRSKYFNWRLEESTLSDLMVVHLYGLLNDYKREKTTDRWCIGFKKYRHTRGYVNIFKKENNNNINKIQILKKHE